VAQVRDVGDKVRDVGDKVRDVGDKVRDVGDKVREMGGRVREFSVACFFYKYIIGLGSSRMRRNQSCPFSWLSRSTTWS
jgi:hypothetical protein